MFCRSKKLESMKLHQIYKQETESNDNINEAFGYYLNPMIVCSNIFYVFHRDTYELMVNKEVNIGSQVGVRAWRPTKSRYMLNMVMFKSCPSV